MANIGEWVKGHKWTVIGGAVGLGGIVFYLIYKGKSSSTSATSSTSTPTTGGTSITQVRGMNSLLTSETQNNKLLNQLIAAQSGSQTGTTSTPSPSISTLSTIPNVGNGTSYVNYGLNPSNPNTNVIGKYQNGKRVTTYSQNNNNLKAVPTGEIFGQGRVVNVKTGAISQVSHHVLDSAPKSLNVGNAYVDLGPSQSKVNTTDIAQYVASKLKTAYRQKGNGGNHPRGYVYGQNKVVTLPAIK